MLAFDTLKTRLTLASFVQADPDRNVYGFCLRTVESEGRTSILIGFSGPTKYRASMIAGYLAALLVSGVPRVVSKVVNRERVIVVEEALA